MADVTEVMETHRARLIALRDDVEEACRNLAGAETEQDFETFEGLVSEAARLFTSVTKAIDSSARALEAARAEYEYDKTADDSY